PDLAWALGSQTHARRVYCGGSWRAAWARGSSTHARRVHSGGGSLAAVTPSRIPGRFRSREHGFDARPRSLSSASRSAPRRDVLSDLAWALGSQTHARRVYCGGSWRAAWARGSSTHARRVHSGGGSLAAVTPSRIPGRFRSREHGFDARPRSLSSASRSAPRRDVL